MLSLIAYGVAEDGPKKKKKTSVQTELFFMMFNQSKIKSTTNTKTCTCRRSKFDWSSVIMSVLPKRLLSMASSQLLFHTGPMGLSYASYSLYVSINLLKEILKFGISLKCLVQ